MAYMQLWTDANNLILPCKREREYYFAIFSDIAKSLNFLTITNSPFPWFNFSSFPQTLRTFDYLIILLLNSR